MKNDKTTGSPSIRPQGSTPPPLSFNVASQPQFVRPAPSIQQSNVTPQAESSIASQPANKVPRRYARAERCANGRPNVTEQLRLAIINSRPGYTYKELKKKTFGDNGVTPQRDTLHNVKSEFEFGMSTKERHRLFMTIQSDIWSGRMTGPYTTEAFTNPYAIASLRKQAVLWSREQGNDLKNIISDDQGVRNFLRELTADIPLEHRTAALALIDQPPEYRQPLPGSKAEESAAKAAAAAEAARLAGTNPTQLAAQAQQVVYPPVANASSYPAAQSVSSMAGKRSYSAIDSELTSYGNQLPPFKRSTPAYGNQSFSTAQAQPSSLWSASNGMSRFDVQQQAQQQTQVQPDAPKDHNSGTTTYRPQLFESQAPDPLPSQPSSSWSASNGMSRPISQQPPQPQPPRQIAPSYDTETSNYDPYFFLGESLDKSQAQSQSQWQQQLQSQPRSQPSSSWSASNRMSQSNLQHHPQPQIPQIYNSGNMNYQTNVLQGGQYFGQSQFQSMPHMQNVSNSAAQTFQSSQNYQPYQTHQFDSSNAAQRSNMNGPVPVAQPYNFYGASTAANPVITSDADWAQLLQTIDYLAPSAPATFTQSTPVMPVMTVNNQATTQSTIATPAQRPGATG